jgi:hypothetical protein
VSGRVGATTPFVRSPCPAINRSPTMACCLVTAGNVQLLALFQDIVALFSPAK